MIDLTGNLIKHRELEVILSDITVRDSLQHEEKFIPTDVKLWLAGFKRIEVTNFGNPRGMPQFKDADELMQRIRVSKIIIGRRLRSECVHTGRTLKMLTGRT